MLAYPIVIEDDDGAVFATSPDFPELTTFGDDREEAVARSVHALEEAIAAHIHDRKDIPPPSQGTAYAVLPTLTSGRVGRRRVTPSYRSTFPSAPLRTGRAAFTASGSPVSLQSGSV